MLSARHVHQWGSPWVDNFAIFPLSDDQRRLLYQATEKLDRNIIKKSEIFRSIWDAVDKYISENGPVFFRLSTASPKDVNMSKDHPTLCATSAEYLFGIMVRSFRMMEELMDDEDFSLVLRKWDTRIKEDNEWRCFIIDRQCIAISRMIDCSRPEEKTRGTIESYINKYKHLFPEDNLAIDLVVGKEGEEDDVIFIEFNTLDDELDCFGIFDHEGITYPQKLHRLTNRC